MTDFDFTAPDYVSVFQARADRLHRLRQKPELIPGVKAYYRENPAQFITDWGCTQDPRKLEDDLPALIPFILFPKQVEWCEWIVDHWRRKKPGLTEKSRDSGISWLSVGLSCTLCMFLHGMEVGFGSRKEEYVAISGGKKALLFRAREFMRMVPREFRGAWDAKDHSTDKQIRFPDTGSTISGEAGDDIGRGDRASLYFVDEAAYLPHPELADASLSQTTNCRQDISTPRGMGNPFAQKRHAGKIDVFTFHWRDDPRKGQAWYDKQVEDLDNPVVIAQEIDLDYSASVEGVLIPSAWVQSAIDAHLKRSITPTGARAAALDVADEGKDKNALAMAHGILLMDVKEWSGKGDDIFGTTETAFGHCDDFGSPAFKFDSDGLGAGVRGDARVINERRRSQSRPPIDAEPFRGSEAPFAPEAEDVKGRKNQDLFANRKAQAWWALRTRFEKTHRWVIDGVACDPDDIISLDSTMPLLTKLASELSQPTYSVNGVGKILVDKAPDGAKSPNLADSVMILFSRTARPAMRIAGDFRAAMRPSRRY